MSVEAPRAKSCHENNDLEMVYVILHTSMYQGPKVTSHEASCSMWPTLESKNSLEIILHLGCPSYCCMRCRGGMESTRWSPTVMKKDEARHNSIEQMRRVVPVVLAGQESLVQFTRLLLVQEPSGVMTS